MRFKCSIIAGALLLLLVAAHRAEAAEATEATLVVTTTSAATAQVKAVAPDGAVREAADDDGDGTLTLMLPSAGSYQVTITVGESSETVAVSALAGGTVSINYEPGRRPVVYNLAVSETTTVTARKREEALLDVPQSVQVLTEGTLEAMGAREFVDYARTVPSLSFVDRGPNRNRIILRGVSPLTGVATVGLYIDGLSVSTSFNQPDLRLFDVERVEVLRGPQGTLYGEGSMGGTISVITAKPSVAGLAGKIDFDGASTSSGGDGYKLNGMLNVPLGERFALRAVGYQHDEDGWIDNPRLGLENVNDHETTGGRISGRWFASDRALLTLTGTFQDLEVGAQNRVNALLDELEIDTFFNETQDDELDQLALDVSYNFGSAELVAVLGAVDRSYDLVLDFGIGPSSPADFASDQEIVTGEIRLASTGTSRTSWVAGVFYKDWQQDNRLIVNQLPLAPEFAADLVNDATFDTENLALFGEATYDFNDRLSATLGLRYFEQDEHDTVLGGFPDLGIVTDQADVTASFDDVSPKLSLAYQAGDSTLVYAQLAKGYRAGGTNPASAADPTVPRSYDEDVSWNYELGLKTSAWRNRLSLTGALFFIDWRDVQILGRPDNPLLGFVTNAGDASSTGVELELTARPSSRLDLSFGGSYAEAELDEAAQGGVPGNRLPNVPRYTLNASLQYTAPVSRTLDGIVRFDYSARGKTFSNVTNAPETLSDSYGLGNLRLGLERGDLGLFLYADNLFDERADLDRSDTIFFYRNRPRTIGLSLRYGFGS